MTNHSIAVLILLFAFGCSDSEEQEGHTSENNLSTKPTEMKSDTNPTPALPSEPQIAPRQAKINGRIVSIDKLSTGTSLIYLRVEEVLKYGRSATPIPANDTLAVHSQIDTSFSTGDSITALIQQSFHSVSNTSADWSLVTLDH